MLRIIYTTTFLLLSITIFSQSSEMIVPFFNNGKWGFMNQNKDIKVCPKFEEAYPSVTDRYRVKVKGKYGFIDKAGKMVIKAKYDEAEDFRYGVAKVMRNNKTEYIKRNGKINKHNIAICGNHSSCSTSRLKDGIEIIFSDNKYGIVVHNDQSKLIEKDTFVSDTIQPVFDSIVPISYRVMYLEKDSLFGFLRVSDYWGGSEKVTNNLKLEYEDIQLYPCEFCNSGINEFIGVKKDGLWGYKKMYFVPEEYIEPKYLNINSLAKGFALVEYAKGKYGYIDQQRNEYFFR